MDEYQTVKQFSDKYGKDRANVLRMIHAGRIPAVKLGNQWLIPLSAEMPPDARIKTGNYIHWRKRSR